MSTPPDDDPQEQLDATDRAILACLREDGRMANSEIARRLGVGEKTIRRRIQRLGDERGLRVVPVVDPDRMGLRTCIYIGLRVELSRVEEVAAAVRALPEVRYLAITTGPWNLLAEAFVGSSEHLADLLISTFGHLDGVTAVESFNVLRIAKFGYEWEAPEPPAERPPGVSIAHPTPREQLGGGRP
ncbi:Lrp/AsnC family transcriptional regulator [Patulibacter defluvii]|uniref:Lrp/AsnC family transcriptional regulator n=1 Tax=Patulibacter defluvii TaxID=3095358 RepID=UPI002A75890C|nr:Lrp/AsnC family transcriptional regulator [Patulibacter sp. DM4]